MEYVHQSDENLVFSNQHPRSIFFIMELGHDDPKSLSIVDIVDIVLVTFWLFQERLYRCKVACLGVDGV